MSTRTSTSITRSESSLSSRVFAVACVGTALPNLDLFSVNIALPSIAAEFDSVPLSDLSWILNGYAIAYAALLVFFGRLSEGYRRDRSFILGIVIFSIASAGCALAGGVWGLVLFHTAAAFGAALMTPTSIGLLLATFPPERRASAVRGWAGIGGFAAALGPIVGGLLVTFDWRLVFLANALLGTTAAIVAWRVLPSIPGHPVERPSVVAASLLTFGIAALVFSIIKVNSWGFQSPGIIASAFVAAVLLALFVMHCVRSSNPLFSPSLFRIRLFSGASLAMVPYSVTFGAMLFSVALWGQSAWGWSALQAGLAIIPGPLMVPLTSTFLTGRLIARCGAAMTVTLGVGFVVLGFGLWALLIGLTESTGIIVAGMLLNGIGVGLIFPSLMGTGTQELPPTSFATGSGMINMLRQASIAIGVAIFVAIVGTKTSMQDQLSAFRIGWWLMAAITCLTLWPTFVFLRKQPELQASVAAPKASPLPTDSDDLNQL
ncbi:MFS transporter [uncultured Marinobacter sp.]|uniref:MFS transporter n=1 Tax=uncultured Marinobacter sp. TaxID=187379 RepID=UPI0030DD5CC7